MADWKSTLMLHIPVVMEPQCDYRVKTPDHGAAALLAYMYLTSQSDFRAGCRISQCMQPIHRCDNPTKSYSLSSSFFMVHVIFRFLLIIPALYMLYGSQCCGTAKSERFLRCWTSLYAPDSMHSTKAQQALCSDDKSHRTTQPPSTLSNGSHGPAGGRTAGDLKQTSAHGEGCVQGSCKVNATANYSKI
jgi:hypothetical protein